MAERIENPVTDEERIYNLVLDLGDEKRRKKAAMKDFNENIKRLQEEIDEILDQGSAETEEEAD
jgi:hypothetical protein